MLQLRAKSRIPGHSLPPFCLSQHFEFLGSINWKADQPHIQRKSCAVLHEEKRDEMI